MKTKFVNGTNCVITITEGTGGLEKIVCTLQKKDDEGSFDMFTLEKYITYREYFCVGIPKRNGHEAIVTHDDLVDHEEIIIMETGTPAVFYWKGTRRSEKDRQRFKARKPRNETAPASTTSTRPGTSSCAIM